MSGDRAQALVELAVTLPVLLLLTAGIMLVTDVGIARLALEHGAAEAARTGALTNDDALIRATAAAAVAPLDPSTLGVVIDPPANQSPRTDRPRGTLLHVRLRHAIAVPLGFTGLPRVTVESTATRSIEWSP